MQSGFTLFGPFHLAVLGFAPALGGLAGWVLCRYPAARRPLRLALAILLIANELSWYAYNLYQGWAQFPDNLPLQLCDLTTWASIFALLTLRQPCFELAWYAGIGGAAMALLTPDIGWAEFPSYPTLYYFLSHGGLITALTALVWGKLMRPSPGSMWRAFLYTNLFAAVMGLFNALFGANYLYLCEKPQSPTLLDYFGPWPLYIGLGEVFALAIFALLWLPFRQVSRPPKALP